MSINLIPDFSVLLAVCKKDDPTLLKKALDSIFSNTLQPYEVVIVADGPLTDDLMSLMRKYLFNRQIRLIKLPYNLGLAAALNAGLSTVKTKYTLRADADDFNHHNRFELLIEKLREGFDLVGSAIREVDKVGVEVAYRSCPLTENNIRQFARKRNPFNHMTVGFRTAAVVQAGGYPSIYLKEDYALWATLLAKGCRVCNLKEVLVNASAGREMFRRRGGLRYALAEINLQHHLVKCKLKSAHSALIDGVLRSVIFLAPNAFREFFYLKFLRKHKEEE